MTLDVQEEGGRSRVRLGGRWTVAEAAALRAGIAGLRPGSREAVFDAAGIEALDLSGAWVLWQAEAACQAAGCRVAWLPSRPGLLAFIDRMTPAERELPAAASRPAVLAGILQGVGEAAVLAKENALDFLDAPRRLMQFIEGRSLRVFMRPTGLAAKVAGRGASVALSVFKRIVGFDLLADLAEFFNAFSGMVDGFQARAKRVNSLLADERTCFLVVCGPQGEPVDEAVYFHRKLVEAKLPFGGVIVNKVHYPAERLRGEGDDLEGPLAAKLGDDDLARRVAANFADYQALAERDARNIERLARELRTTGVIRVPYLDEDVHDLAGLAEIDRYLFASSEERIELAAGRA